MFETLIREAATRFGLGDKAGPLVQMLLAYITNKDTGGLGGFVSKFTQAGLGNVVTSWLGGGASALPVNPTQLESVLGGQGGLLGNLTSKLGVNASTATSAIGFLLPAIIGKLTPGGAIPTSLSSELMGFISGGKDLLTGGAAAVAGGVAHGASAVAGGVAHGATAITGGAAAGMAATKAAAGATTKVAGQMAGAGISAGKAAGGGLMKWLPWLAAGAAALFLLSYCNKPAPVAVDATKAAAIATVDATADAAKAAASATASAATATVDAAKATADSAKSAADAAAKAVAEAIPAGAGAIASMFEGAPALKVYFDTGKVEVAPEFAAKSKDIVDYLKANAGAKAVVSGYNDPTGNAAANAELSKKRAQAVAGGIKAAGIAEDRVLLEKPANTTAGAALSNAEARRVEVTIRK